MLMGKKLEASKSLIHETLMKDSINVICDN